MFLNRHSARPKDPHAMSDLRPDAPSHPISNSVGCYTHVLIQRETQELGNPVEIDFITVGSNASVGRGSVPAEERRSGSGRGPISTQTETLSLLA